MVNLFSFFIFYSSTNRCFSFSVRADVSWLLCGYSKSIFGLDQTEVFHLRFNVNRDIVNVYLGTEGSSCCECYLSRFGRVYLDFPFLANFVKD
jgi:hypothetical protein